MPYPEIASPPEHTEDKPPLWVRRWQGITPSGQDLIMALIPLLAVFIFIGAIASAFWYLNNIEQEQQLVNTKHSVEAIKQQLRLQLMNNEDSLYTLAMEIRSSDEPQNTLNEMASEFIKNHPEITVLYWHDLENNTTYTYSAAGSTKIIDNVKSLESFRELGVVKNTFATSGSNASPISTDSFFIYHLRTPEGTQVSLMESSVAVPSPYNAQGVLTATYELDRLLRNLVPAEISFYSTVWLQDKNGDVLASTNSEVNRLNRPMDNSLRYGVETHNLGSQLMIYAQSAHSPKSVMGNVLFWLTACLCLLIIVLLLLNWRHMRRRISAQKNMQREANFRRAMENSMMTGLRALDRQGRILYVNPAFCLMTGYSQDELIGQMPPYPYWPKHNYNSLHQTVGDELSDSPLPTGYEQQLQRKNGELFFARLYVSPLIDTQGTQSGWITAITDISEAKRIREELALSGQRFTTVLEGVDSAISVVAVGSDELLFANHTYLQLFDNDAKGHLQLAEQAQFSTSSVNQSGNNFIRPPKEVLGNQNQEPREVFVSSIDRWFEVRSRYMPWVDGRLTQMLISTDITEKHRAHEQAAIQAEQAQEANRLITMGEMASSVAHELNQPLTAISNYSTGLISRIKSGMLTEPDLIAALEKTARQAKRAGKIIQRIQQFVKKSTANRTLTTIDEIMENVQELAEIDMKRRHIQFNIHIENGLPMITVDPILIEQVLLNLIRNGAEAIDNAQRPADQRQIDVHIERIQDPQFAWEHTKEIEFKVCDTGTGVPPQLLKQIFDTFFTTKSKGLGIGLNLCRSIIESHGGHLDINNIYKDDILMGCCCTFTLPLAKYNVTTEDRENTQSSQNTLATREENL